MQLDDITYRLDHPGRTGMVAFFIGFAGILLCVLGYMTDAEKFYYSYLVAFAFWLEIGLGALFFVMLHHLTGAVWSVVVRRIAEGLMITLPLMVLFFIPIVFGMHDLFHWSHHDVIAQDPMLQRKTPYLNTAFFLFRAAIYFAIWSLLCRSLWKISIRQDQAYDVGQAKKLRRISAPGMILLTITLSFAAIDWLMSLDPHWYSTIFGVYYGSGAMLAIMAILIQSALHLRVRGVLAKEITIEHYHDLGKLFFAFMILWAYMAFSQYFLIWYANIPEETEWFRHRWGGGWKTLSLIIVIGQFGVPFLALMSRSAKRNLKVLGFFSLWILAMRWIDLYWIVMPTMRPESYHFNWIDFPPMLAIGGIVVWFAWRHLSAHPLVPVNDPKLRASIEFINRY
jgi:hypothetical protein